MERTRKSHPPEFKVKVVLEMLREEKSLAEISSQFGVHATQLHRWRREVMEKLPEVFARKENWQMDKAQYEAKIEELYTEIGRLSAQISWLKKKGIDVDSP